MGLALCSLLIACAPKPENVEHPTPTPTPTVWPTGKSVTYQLKAPSTVSISGTGQFPIKSGSVSIIGGANKLTDLDVTAKSPKAAPDGEVGMTILINPAGTALAGTLLVGHEEFHAVQSGHFAITQTSSAIRIVVDSTNPLTVNGEVGTRNETLTMTLIGTK